MATADLSGLFGGNLTPEEQQRQLTEARAAQFAQLAPSQQLAFMGYKAGAGLGQGLAQAAGVDIQDPAIKRATQLRQLAQGIDVTNVEGLQQYAARLQQAGFNAEANQLGQQILAARKTESEITKNERERKGLDPFEQLLRTGKYTPASLAKYKKSGDAADLELMEKETKANIKEIGVAEGTREPVYLDVNNDKQFIYKTDENGNQVRKLYTGGVDRTTAKISATATSKGEEAFTTELGKLDAKAVDAAQKARDASIATVKALNTLSSYPDERLISGSFANNRVGIANFLNTLGLANGTDKERISNSQQYQKVAGDVILQTLGGKLGSGFSNADREFISSLVPQLETSPKARRALIEFMQKKNQDIIAEATRLEDYARANKGLGGFKPTIPLSSGVGGGADLSAMSDDELLRIARGKK
jgi:aerobic-type carbon monoxide dehydrogenase small subunit (CoxS/CutS family)